MECTLALLADFANREENGKLNVLGIFDRVQSPKYPYAVPQFFVVIKLTAGPAEYGSKKDVQIVLLDPDGRPKGKINAKGEVPTPEEGGRAAMELVLGMIGVPFEKPGNYAIAVLVNGEEKASIPLEAVLVKNAPTRRRKKADGN
jgi:hypothetical protein